MVAPSSSALGPSSVRVMGCQTSDSPAKVTDCGVVGGGGGGDAGGGVEGGPPMAGIAGLSLSPPLEQPTIMTDRASVDAQVRTSFIKRPRCNRTKCNARWENTSDRFHKQKCGSVELSECLKRKFTMLRSHRRNQLRKGQMTDIICNETGTLKHRPDF